MSSSGSEPNETSSCAEIYEDTYLPILLGVRCALSFISSICIGCMIALMIIFQKYRVFTQRLILYLAISTLIYQAVSTIDVTSIQAYSNERALHYCKFIGFITQVVVWWPILATCIIVFDIFMKVLFFKKTEGLEKLFIVLIFVSPLLFSWVPFIDRAYGPTGYFCWIKDRNFEDCSKYEFGFIVRFVLFFVPIYVLTGLLFVLLTASFIAIRKKRNTFFGSNKEEKTLQKMMEKEIKPLLGYPFIFLIPNVFSLILSLYTVFHGSGGDEVVAIGLITSILYRLEGVAITLVFILDSETRKKLNTKSIKDAWKQMVQREKTIDYPVMYERSDSRRVVINADTGKQFP